jgi:dTDP-4-dehydrorhamnose 3,5-epimerase
MEIKERKLRGVFEIHPRPHIDNRGFFMRVFDEKLFEAHGLNRRWVQENHSRTEQKGIIRGLHFQLPPYAETKLIRCISGAVFDVFVDLRSDSDTFGQWDAIELSAENKLMVIVPRGFAHGFCTLTKTSEVVYKVDNFYSKEHEAGLIWNDPDLSIDWPVRNPVLSEKDHKNLTFKEFINKHNSINL